MAIVTHHCGRAGAVPCSEETLTKALTKAVMTRTESHDMTLTKPTNDNYLPTVIITVIIDPKI